MIKITNEQFEEIKDILQNLKDNWNKVYIHIYIYDLNVKVYKCQLRPLYEKTDDGYTYHIEEYRSYIYTNNIDIFDYEKTDYGFYSHYSEDGHDIKEYYIDFEEHRDKVNDVLWNIKEILQEKLDDINLVLNLIF